MRYANNDYFLDKWFFPKMIHHPNTKLNGTDLSTYEDAKVKKLFVEMSKISKSK